MFDELIEKLKEKRETLPSKKGVQRKVLIGTNQEYEKVDIPIALNSDMKNQLEAIADYYEVTYSSLVRGVLANEVGLL